MSVENKSLLVRGLIENFENKGLEVLSANYPNFKKPEIIHDQQPDVIAWDPKKELYHIGVATYSDELNQPKIHKKLNVLGNMAMAAGISQNSKILLYLGTPFESTEKISAMLVKNDFSEENIIPVGVGRK